ncbi:MAG: ABC transporter ATP-binding protein, partial [Candidatus Spyradocola sp.]
MSERKADKRGLTRLMPFLRPQLKVLLLCLLMVLLVNAAELAKPYILEIVIDRYLTTGRPDQGLDAVWVLALSYLMCTAMSSLLNVTESVMVNRMGQSILMDIRKKVFDHIQHMSMKTLDHFSSGRLVTRATNDVETLNELFSDVLVNLFKDVFMLLGIVVMMLVINWRLALVAFSVVPLIALITVLVRKKLRRNFVKLKALTGRINGFFAENMSGMRIVQIFRREKEKHAEFDELNVGYYKAARTQVRMNSLMRPLVEVVNQLGIAILVCYGCRHVGLGTLEIGMLYAFTNYIKQFFEPINDLAEKYTTISSAVVSTDRIFELLDDQSQLEDTVSGKPVRDVRGRVEFQHVWFAYNDENWVLKDVSFTIEPGQSIAFVGTTGAGKSTIISLISRFYTIQKGRILLDGQDINELSLEQL